MNLALKRKTVLGSLLVTISLLSGISYGQQTPLSTDSYWVFVPYIYNPAIVGSKDFLSVGANVSFKGPSNTQLLSGNGRISKTHSGYFSSRSLTKFTGFGAGGTIFNDENGLSRNYGLSAAGSYQIAMDRKELSFLSFGLAVKETRNTISTDSAGIVNSLRKTYYTNIDFGIYYYGTSVFAGISGVNLLGSPFKPDTVGIYKVPVSREYFFTAGFKVLLSKSMNIVLEPSVLISATDSTFDKITENIDPIVKLYLDKFYVGASYRGSGKISIFAQYRYPHIYVGAYYGFKNKAPYFKDRPVVELTFGINFQSDRYRNTRSTHW
jgi:type IX secretion system PorP/SprF family membrane protein